VANFDVFLPLVLKFEGGYCDNTIDPGGETNKGITMQLFQMCSHELLGLEPTSDNLKALTDSQAGIIYRTQFWMRMNGDAFALQDLANIVCDFYVNSGSNAATLLQRILIVMGASLVVDGMIGHATLQALAARDEVLVYRSYKTGRIGYYQNLGKRFPQYLDGWLRRVNSFPDL